MQLTQVKELLTELMDLEVPISNTTRGEQIQQTYRNKFTAKLREALFEDCKASFPEGSDIIPFITKDGVILEVPNDSIADNMENDIGSGAISIEMSFTIKGLEYNASDESDNYALDLEEKAAKKKDAEKKKAEKIARDRKAREEREAKRARLATASRNAVFGEDED